MAELHSVSLALLPASSPSSPSHHLCSPRAPQEATAGKTQDPHLPYEEAPHCSAPAPTLPSQPCLTKRLQSLHSLPGCAPSSCHIPLCVTRSAPWVPTPRPCLGPTAQPRPLLPLPARRGGKGPRQRTGYVIEAWCCGNQGDGPPHPHEMTAPPCVSGKAPAPESQSLCLHRPPC